MMRSCDPALTAHEPCVPMKSRPGVCVFCNRRIEPCDHAGSERSIDRATGEERCADCGAPVKP